MAAWKLLKFLHLALLGGLLAATAVFYLVPSGVRHDAAPADTMLYVGAGLALTGVLAGQLLLPRVVRGRLSGNTKLSDDPSAWVGAYQTGKLLQWSLIEGPALFLGITHWQTGNQVAIVGAVAWWAYLAYVRPGASELARLIEKDPSRVESALRAEDSRAG
ncbi:MAG: hypothetical protein H7A21_19545 [Spirochaetales bacterium]|nr:hypothetical protein [Leptospiraceae bacterium]MCP5483641.1 hypothetical protein [Spirochaetales bacterium]MCP5484494.1 hypothetical protein [Spirochaetales bacterium]